MQYTCILVETCTRRGRAQVSRRGPFDTARIQYVGSIKRPRRESQNSFRSFPGWICLRDGLSLGKFMLGSALLDILSQFLESHLVVDRHNAHRALQSLDEGIDCSSGTPAVFVSLLNRLLAPTGTDQCPHEHRVRSEMWA